MEATVKLRLLLTSTLFLFVQIPTMQAQETLDLAKITCQQFMGEQLATPSRDIVLLLAGYYNGKRNNTIIEPQRVKKEDEEVQSYCYQHRETTVMDAVKTVLALTNEGTCPPALTASHRQGTLRPMTVEQADLTNRAA